MTVEQPLAEQQRAVAELYIRPHWVKANLTLEDENLFIEYALDRHDSSTAMEPTETSNQNLSQHNGSMNSSSAERISSQKRSVRIVKSENVGLGKIAARLLLHRAARRLSLP